MRACLLLVTVTLLTFTLWGVPGFAQQMPGMGSFEISADDVTVTVGESFSIPVLIETATPVAFFGLYVTNDPSQCQPTTFLPGAGAVAYEAQNGAFPCDVGILPDHIFLNMSFQPLPYDSDIYGTEIAILSYQVTAAAPGSTTVVILNGFTMEPAATVTVNIVDEPSEFLRGDVNGDGTCNVADAIKLLQLLFAPGEISDCWDSADVEDNGILNIADAIRLLQILFADPTTVPETTGQEAMVLGPCGLDSTADNLPACVRDSCQ